MNSVVWEIPVSHRVIEEDSDLFRINTETDNQLDFAVKLLNG